MKSKSYLFISITFFLAALLVYGEQLNLINREEYRLHILKTTSALCLDGSPAAYYESLTGNSKKILLYFDGGGWCGDSTYQTTIQSCYKRSQQFLGSSKHYKSFLHQDQGILSKAPKNYFRDWKRVLLSYCDGCGHQGYRKEPIEYRKQKLYFRGHNITIQQLENIDKSLGLFTGADQIVIAGGSAGGLAVFLWANYIAQKVKHGKVRALIDSGIFLDSNNIYSQTPLYKEGFSNIIKIANTDIDPPVPECIRKFPNARENCMFAQNIYQYIKIPQFIIQSLYDKWSILNILGTNCTNYTSPTLQMCTDQQRSVIDVYRKNLTEVIVSIGQINKGLNGYWAPACARHGFTADFAQYSADFAIPQYSKYEICYCIQQWFEGGDQNAHIDKNPWPDNKPCSGLRNLSIPLLYNVTQELLQ